MLFERENAKSFERPSEARLRLELGRLRGYGKTSFASLTAEDGSYVQVAGGGVACTVEWHPADGRQLRGYQDIPKVPFPDGTPLRYSGGWVQMLRDEWFFVEQVADVFVAFRFSREFPAFLHWRDYTDQFRAHGVGV